MALLSRLKSTQILALGFALLIFIGAFLLNLPMASADGKSIGIIDAFFTATSAVCVTGLVVVDTGTHWSLFGQLVILMLIQIGGLGFMTMATLVFLLLGKKITLKERLIIREALNQFSLAGLVKLTKYILIFTFIVESIGAVLLAAEFLRYFPIIESIYYGVFHSVSAFNNAGFDLMGNYKSFTPFTEDLFINIIIITLIIVGGIGFTVLLDIYDKRCFKTLSLHSKFVIAITITLIVLGFFVILILEYNNPYTLKNLNCTGKIMGALFHSVTPRTAGFNTLPTDRLTTTTKFFTIIYMYIGGSPGSTAGGIKTTTAGTLVAVVWAIISGKKKAVIFKKSIPEDIVFRALAITMLGLIYVTTIIMLLTITEEEKFIDIFFEAVSAFGTVGLSMGITPELSNIGKLLIILTMFSGRVGLLTIALAFGEKVKKAAIKFPEEKIHVG